MTSPAKSLWTFCALIIIFPLELFAWHYVSGHCEILLADVLSFGVIIVNN